MEEEREIEIGCLEKPKLNQSPQQIINGLNMFLCFLQDVSYWFISFDRDLRFS
jgi:hypothetical protein